MGLFDFLKRKQFEEINQLQEQLEKYKPIDDIEKEVERQNQILISDISKKTAELEKIEADYSDLKSNYQSALETYTNLRKEIGLYENKLDLVEFGVYEPVYDFEKSDDYRAEQSKIIEQQKLKIETNKAATCTANWTIDGSEAKGKASTRRFIKLILRAFNGECDALIAKVKWNNIAQMQERINKSFEAINKLGESQRTYIETDYKNLKLKELILEHEYQLKRQKEKEELRSAQEELRRRRGQEENLNKRKNKLKKMKLIMKKL